MPNVKSLDELNRSQKEILEELHEKGEPLYLTLDGSACVVVMDAAAFDGDRWLSSRATLGLEAFARIEEVDESP